MGFNHNSENTTLFSQLAIATAVDSKINYSDKVLAEKESCIPLGF